MPQLKIMVLGDETNEQSLFESIEKSDFSKITYTAGEKTYSKNFIPYSTYDELAQNALEKGIELVITDSEKDIFNGIVEILKSYGLECIGTNRKYSRLSSSKLFSKKFLDKYNIPYLKEIKQENLTFPLRIKRDFSDYSCLILSQEDFDKKHVNSNEDYFLEEFVSGTEISITTFYNSEKLIPFEPVKIHKKEFINVGSFCPVYISYEQYDKLQNFLTKFEHALLEDDANFKGFITTNLVWNENDWYVIDFKINIGNSTLLNHLKSDFLATILYGARQKYKEKTTATLIVNCNNNNLNLPKNENIKTAKKNNRQNFSITTTTDFPFKYLENYLENIKNIEYQKNLNS